MSEKVTVECQVPASENSRVFKEECIFCFHTPEHDDGLYVCLVTHLGFCPKHLSSHKPAKDASTAYNAYLHFKRLRKRAKPKDGQPEQKITKLAIGVEGGLQETQYEFDETYELVIFPGPTKYQLTDPRLDTNVRSCCDAMIACDSATRLQELASLAGTWDGSFVIRTKHIDLPQLTPPPKIPPTPKDWRCQADGCDKTDNLWLNLTDGKMFCGRSFYDGSGGNNHAVEHYTNTGFPLAVKLGTITSHGTADVFSYSEDEMVMDPKLEEHLLHFGINMKAMEKTEKTMAELELDLNQKHEFSRIQESGHDLKPVYGPGFTGLVNLGSSCYMNTALQTLAMVPDIQRLFAGDAANRIFTEFIYPFRSGQNRQPTNPDEDMRLQFAKLFSGLLSGDFSKKPKEKVDENIILPDNSVRPLNFRTLIGKNHQEFASRRQQDVEEYLRHLFEKLESRQVGGDSVVEAFRFETLERIFCQATGRNCGDRHPETLLCLPVPMEKAVNLEEVRVFEKKRKEETAAGRKIQEVVFSKVPLTACLEAYAAPCIIENALSPFDDKIKTTLTKTQRMATFPDYLLVQVKKFTHNIDWSAKKLEVEILVDDVLNLESIGAGSQDEPMDTTPKLRPKTPPPNPHEIAGVMQLMDAGFPRNASMKAWRTSGGQMDAAFDWLLAHGSDPDFDQPEAAVVGTIGNQNPPAPPNENAIVEVVNMGFTRNQALKALRLGNGNVENAVGWLLDHPDDPGEPEAAAAAVAQVEQPKAVAKKCRNGPGKYRLVGIISHMGLSTHSGHYVCHLLKMVDKQERWVIFNDEKVALSEDPPKGFGYVYLYERMK